MRRNDELARENEALRERLSRLSEASLRINESLDFQAVLQGVLDSACSLTGSRYGVITLLDHAGRVEDFLCSGMTSGESALLSELPDGSAFFGYLSGIEEPLRLRDFHSHVKALGLPEFNPPVAVSPVLPFLAVPIRHMGERIGAFYVAETEASREFTSEDEETLVMFASQAALVIANARRHREEQRARADLETLVDTSPVGVAVFDARSGAPLTLNREARRLVDGLRDPDQSIEELLEVFTVRRADGQEFSLMEFPLAKSLQVAETVRAEEIVIGVPDGRSVRLLVNATPIRPAEGEVESVIVTLQDMTPMEELERLRAEFLAMVSHELRGPLASIKGSAATVMGDTSTFGPAEMVQFFRIIDRQADEMNRLISDLLDVARIETGTLPVNPEPVLVAALVDQARSAFQSRGSGHNIRIDLPPDLPRVMADPRRIVQVLGNLLSNAARHSPESSPIRVSAVHADFHVSVTVEDWGRGLPTERMSLLFQKFFRLEEDQRGDTGLGLAICKGIVEAHGGRIWAESDGQGRGSRFTFTVPVLEEAAPGAATVPASSTAGSRWTGKEQVRILAVDDDPQALRYVQDTLTKAGYTAIGTGDPKEALDFMEARMPHLVLLDLVLPGADGVELMKDIRVFGNIPVIFLSAYGQEDVIARAFDMGADDYIVKPFSPTELIARIRATLRKRASLRPSEPAEPYTQGGLRIDYAQRNVSVAGNPVRLTAIEYRLLVELSANAGETLTYDHLQERVWDRRGEGDLRPMRSAVRSLRRKLGDDAKNPTYIFNDSRIGYRMPHGETPKQGDG